MAGPPDRQIEEVPERGPEAVLRPVRLKDIAAETGFSLATVSQALNEKGSLPDSTRRLIKEAARKMGYQPNANARNLAGRLSGVIVLAVSISGGMPFPVSGFEYFSEITTAATVAALERGFALVSLPMSSNSIEGLRKFHPDGALILDPVSRDPLVDHLRANAIPMVTLGRIPDEPAQKWWVDSNVAAGVRGALEHLEGAGARRIGMITTPAFGSYPMDCITAYEQWCAERGAERLIAVGRDDATERAGFAAAVDLLDRKDPVDAIFAGIDSLALGALLAATERGVSVPGDLMIIGGTNSVASLRAEPPLSAIDLHPGRLASAALGMLATIIAGDTPPEQRIVLPPELVQRVSTRRSGDRG